MLPASDVHGACVRVKRALRRAKFPLNERGTRIDADVRNGAGEFFVAALRHVLCSRSSVSRDIGDRGHDLLGIENDLRFTERAFRAMIDVFGYKPRVSASQFASASGFAVVKMTTLLDALAHVEACETEINRRDRDGVRRPERRARSRARFPKRESTQPATRMETRFVTFDEDSEDESVRAFDVRAFEDWDFVDAEGGVGNGHESAHRTALERSDGTMYSNPQYLSPDCRAIPLDFDRLAVDTLRVEFAEMLGRLSRVEKELTIVTTKYRDLEQRIDVKMEKATTVNMDNDNDEDDVDEKENAMSVLESSHSPRDLANSQSPKETTEQFISRYIERLRELSARDEWDSKTSF
ncbi:unnamed product [Ostreococcus tauri]|uniref:Unnamed product n=1 Tax=Ostreococcus tauri TaxID=70448 RepID=A0A090M673_OSTTA|nr:unnamed product [Ostreococcus tauri]CEF99740.1 unnamed product [Ostreococcus tauri]|eukprot:XP_022840004.1 unnamed product [Ostreococcus tauri]